MRYALFACMLVPAALAQNPCGISMMTHAAAPIYPPIAKAAHVRGVVVALVTFKPSGEADRYTFAFGPEMLRVSAGEYIKGLRANSFSGPRSCPIVVTYRLGEEGNFQDGVEYPDVQHTSITARSPMLETTY